MNYYIYLLLVALLQVLYIQDFNNISVATYLPLLEDVLQAPSFGCVLLA